MNALYLNTLLNDVADANIGPWHRRHSVKIPIHWRFSTFETIEIRRRHTGVVERLASIAAIQKTFISKTDGRITFAP